jgi:serine/threonine protein kinase
MIGVLQKQGASVTGWRERLFVLDSERLCYYDVPPVSGQAPPPGTAGTAAAAPASGATPRGAISVASLINVRPSSSDARVLRVTVDAAASLDTYCALSGGAPGARSFELLASSEAAVAAWSAALSAAAFSPARAVRLLRDVTAAWRERVLCTREWELCRALVAAGTGSSLKTAARLLDCARARPRAARASDAVESALLDFALAHSEAALVGVLAGLRRLCHEPLRAALREKIVEIAISKYGDGGWLGSDESGGGPSGSASPVPAGSAAASGGSRGASSRDGITAAVSRGWTGHVWLGGSDSSSAPSYPNFAKADWTPVVQEAFALFLHSIAAAVQRARVARRAASTNAAAEAAAVAAAAAAEIRAAAGVAESPAGRPRVRSVTSRVRLSFRYGDPETLASLENIFEKSGLLDDYQLARAARDDGGPGVSLSVDEEDEGDDDEFDDNLEDAVSGEKATLSAVALSDALRVADAGTTVDLREPGSFFEHYELLDRLGEGAYSLVYHTRHKATGLGAAVKICAKDRMSDADCVRLVEEVAIMARLSHPSILSLYSFFEDPKAFYLVMELCPGGELFERITTRPTYTEVEARDTIRTLASALAHMHSHGIAHRDLKPENILLSSADDNFAHIKLGDLGFAKRTPASGYTTSCGTPSYVAPEILRSEPYNQACDLWSLGVVLYILLCGYAPFSSPNQSDLFKAIVSGRFYFDAPYWSKISSSAKDLIRKLLEVDIKKRYTAEEVLAHPWLHGTVSTADLSTAQTAMRSFNEARRRIVKIGTLIKQGQVVRSWNRRAFVLTPTTLAYYKNEEIARTSAVTQATPSSSLAGSLMATVGLATADSATALARGVIELKDIVACEPCELDAATLTRAGAGDVASAFVLRIAGGRTLTMIAPDLSTRSSWLAAISATKAHGDLVSKAWTALGGDHAAEVIQLMSLARDWESLVLNDAISTPFEAMSERVSDSPVSRESSNALSPVLREQSGGSAMSPRPFSIAVEPGRPSFDVLVSAKVKAVREEEAAFVAAAQTCSLSRQSSSKSRPASTMNSPVTGASAAPPEPSPTGSRSPIPSLERPSGV